MEVRKGHKKTDLGIIPNDWELKSLGDVVDRIIGGGTPSRSNKEFWGNEIPWVTVKDFATFNPFYTQEFITKKGLDNSASHLIPKETLITSTRMGLGKVVIYKVDVSINQDLKAIFPTKFLSSEYLYYWFQKNSTVIEKLGSGSTVMGISLNELKLIPFLLPPTRTEQTAIATALSDADALITSLEKLIAKKRLIKQGAMQELLSSTGLGGKPKEGWMVKKLGEIANFKNGKAHENFIDENGDFIVINSKFVSTEGEIYKRSNFAFELLRKGEIALVMSDIPNGKALAKCFIVREDNKYTLNQRICSIRSDFYDNEFLYRILNRNEYFLAFDSGVGQTNLKKQEVLDCPIIIPPTIQEQTRIATILSDMDAEITTLETKLEKYRKIKLGMMQELLTGRIRLI